MQFWGWDILFAYLILRLVDNLIFLLFRALTDWFAATEGNL